MAQETLNLPAPNVEPWEGPMLNYFVYNYRKTLHVCGVHSLSVFTLRVPDAFDFVG